MSATVKPAMLGGSVRTELTQPHGTPTPPVVVALSLASEYASCVQWLTPEEARQVAANLLEGAYEAERYTEDERRAR